MMLLTLALPVGTASPPACDLKVLAVTVNAATGDFNGMSHSGTWVMLANKGRQSCTLTAQPTITMQDSGGRTLPIHARAQPTGRAVVLKPGTAVATGLRWVSGPFYDHSRCHDVRSLKILTVSRPIVRPLSAEICGPDGKYVTFEQAPLTTKQTRSP